MSSQFIAFFSRLVLRQKLKQHTTPLTFNSVFFPWKKPTPTKHQEFAKGHVTCIDCGLPDADWATVSCGAYLCVDCAGDTSWVVQKEWLIVKIWRYSYRGWQATQLHRDYSKPLQGSLLNNQSSGSALSPIIVKNGCISNRIVTFSNIAIFHHEYGRKSIWS